VNKYFPYSLILLGLTITSCTQTASNPTPTISIQESQPKSPIFVEEKEKNIEITTSEFTITAKQFSYEPSEIRVRKGDEVVIKINNVDIAHGFAIPDLEVFGLDGKHD